MDYKIRKITYIKTPLGRATAHGVVLSRVNKITAFAFFLDTFWKRIFEKNEIQLLEPIRNFVFYFFCRVSYKSFFGMSHHLHTAPSHLRIQVRCGNPTASSFPFNYPPLLTPNPTLTNLYEKTVHCEFYVHSQPVHRFPFAPSPPGLKRFWPTR